MQQLGLLKRRSGVAVSAEQSKAQAWVAADSKAAEVKEGAASSPAPWSAEQQKQLECAMKKYPAGSSEDVPDRWSLIAGDVDGKSKKECINRYKEIASLLRKQRAAPQ